MPRFPSPTLLISLQDVALRLYDRVLFEHTTWEIRDDQAWAVIGPNGSGKSTLMRALCGHVPVVKGKITYHFSPGSQPDFGLGGSALPQACIAHVSFDAQRGALAGQSRYYQARWNSGISVDSLCVSDYLSQSQVEQINPFQVIDVSTDPGLFLDRRRRVVERLRIGGLLERNLIQLSSGEMRKVQMARALLRNPRLLILDNPFTGLDAGFRARLNGIIERIMEDGTRVIVVTAREQEVPPHVTHVLSVANDRVIAQGPREVVLGTGTAGASGGSAWGTGLRFTLPPERPAEQRVTDPALVRMEKVNVSYGDAQVLSEIDWTVRKGEHWALLGANGSGKTTLLSLILADHPQGYASQIILFGRRRGSGESIWEIKQHIGWVASELHLYHPPGLSCLDVVCSGFYDSVGLYRLCSSRQRETAEAWMDDLGIQGYASRPFQELSQGEQRLVLVARALVKRPDLLLLDEPCQGLDARNRDRVLALIDSIGQHMDTSVVYVTHDTGDLPRIITRVLRLEEGRIGECAPVRPAVPVEA